MENFILQLEILWPGLVAGLLILSTHIPLGQEVLKRGIIFLDLAIAQIAALGVILAHTILSGSHWIDTEHTTHFVQTLIAVLAAMIGAFGLYQIRHVAVKIQEAIIGILFICSATGSILLLAADPHSGEKIKAILVGQILWIHPSDLLSLAACYAAILGAWFKFSNKHGAWIFYPLFAITITLSTQVVGVYLVFASLIIPAVATINLKRPLLTASVIGILGYVAGLFFSAIFDLPAGATIVWCLTLSALGFYVATKKRISALSPISHEAE